MNFNVGEINVICSNLEDSLRFYRDTLGFTDVGSDDGAWRLRSGSTSILLLPFAACRPAAKPYGAAPAFSLDLTTPSVEEAYRYLKDRGVEFTKEWSPGDTHFFIRDPDGLTLEVIDERI